jgi:hypothetical protein
LIADLKFRGKDSWLVPIKQDPGSMDQKAANLLVDSILKF